MNTTIILSAGHNPSKTGANWQGITEYSQTNKWIVYIADLLEALEYSVVTVPTGGLKSKVKWVNDFIKRAETPCVALELHFNAAGTTYINGNETLYYPGSKKGKALAKKYNKSFMKHVVKHYAMKDRGIKEGWYRMDRPGVIDFYGDKDGDEMPDYWLRKTKCPSLILEPAFLCQTTDFGESWNLIADCVVQGIVDMLKK